MLNRMFTLGMGAMAAALLLFGESAEATVIALNGGTVVSDTYEGDTVGSDAVADVGTWAAPTFGRQLADVTDAGAPGPSNGSQYLSLVDPGTAALSVGADLTLAATDTVQIESMVYVPTAEEAGGQLLFFLFEGGGGSASQYLLSFHVNTDDTWGGFGITPFDAPGGFARDQWQRWVVDVTAGASTATLTIDGVSTVIDVPSTTLSGSNYRLSIMAGSGNKPVYLDNVPEPASLALVGLGGLAMLRRNQRWA